MTDLVGQAAGRVWLADGPDPAASISWRTGTGRYRNVGARVRTDVEHVEPSLEDAYLLLRASLEDDLGEEVASWPRRRAAADRRASVKWSSGPE